MSEPPPYGIVARGLIRGRVTPLLGAGVNLFGRAPGDWLVSRNGRLPDGNELATHLADAFDFSDGVRDLVRVSQFVSLEAGEDWLFEELHGIFAADYPPNGLHEFLARLPTTLTEKGGAPAYPLLITTNYDDALERAFAAAQEEYDLFFYATDEHRKGVFVHRRPDGSECPVEHPNEHEPDLLERRSAILKIHGAVNRLDPDRDSYVITEDDYIEYLAHSDISDLVPRTLKARMRQSHFLFLGYSLRDWNLRAFLHRIWAERQREAQSWSIQLAPDRLEQKRWSMRRVDIYDMRLEDFVEKLDESLRERLAENALRGRTAGLGG